MRPAEPRDADAWLSMRRLLWPEGEQDHAPEIEAYFAGPTPRWSCLVAVDDAERVVGFVEVGLRGYAEGCSTSPVGYLEGIFVQDAHRRSGVARELVRAAEAWARGCGCTEMASDRLLENEVSGRFHEALGYEEVERIVCFRRSLT